MNELESFLLNPQRKLLVTNNEIDLANVSSNNYIFILLIEESKGSAGGRGGGSGYRKISQIIGFSISDKSVKKFFDTKESNLIELFEIPYSAVAMDIILSNGKQIVVQGLIDPEMTTKYYNIISS
jgi:hypothetical protein